MKFRVRALRAGSFLLLVCLTGVLTGGRGYAQSGNESVYRVLIQDHQTREQAEEAKRLLDGLGYAPVVLEGEAGQYRVLYGNFTTDAEANQALGQLRNGGVKAAGVVTGRATAAGGRRYAVLAREFVHEADAQALRNQLQHDGFSPVTVRSQGLFFQVLVGDCSMSDAGVLLGQLRAQNLTMARVIEMPSAAPTPVPTPKTASAATTAPTPVSAAAPEPLAPAITQTDEWKKLTPEQQREVMRSVVMESELRRGNPLAQQMIDLDKRLSHLDQAVKDLVTSGAQQKAALDRKRIEIKALYDQAENLIRAGQFEGAMSNLNQILKFDEDDELGQRAFVQRRLSALQSRLNGENYEGQNSERTRQIQSLLEQAQQQGMSNLASDLQAAINLWQNIKQLDPNKYGQTATSQIESLKQKINDIQQREKAAQDATARQMQILVLSLAGIVGVMIVLFALVWSRGRKRHQELMRKVQEITSIRPMRELEGTGPSLLAESLGAATESDIFAPRVPSSGAGALPGGYASVGDSAGDPLTRTHTTRNARTATSTEASPAASAAATGDLDAVGLAKLFDDIASDPRPAKAVPAEPPAARLAEPPARDKRPQSIDDVFASLFQEGAPAATPANAPAALAPKVQPASPAPSRPEPSSAPLASRDLNAMDQPSRQPAVKVAAGADEQFADSPFAEMFAGEPAPEPARTASAALREANEIPAVKLDLAPSDLHAMVGLAEGDEKSTLDGRPVPDRTADLPAFAFDDGGPQDRPTEPEAPGARPGVELTFETDPLGCKPAGWTGDYPYAQLTVETETPPKGSRQYLRFAKPEGEGKALFTYRFPRVSGMVGIEFDLRCNDKNKFLLGFYVERDGDFQHSIHTKILRSEAQTTPTIHIQGESAPYLLGSWAHLKYIVDLENGRINGFIDSTHVVRDLSLAQNPHYLNMLSIRDNINTTGVLLLDNIRVYEL